MDTVIKRPEDEECPSDDYEAGTPCGSIDKGCWGDGHYMCQGCKHYTKEFVGNEELRQAVVSPPRMYITTLNKMGEARTTVIPRI